MLFVLIQQRRTHRSDTASAFTEDQLQNKTIMSQETVCAVFFTFFGASEKSFLIISPGVDSNNSGMGPQLMTLVLLKIPHFSSNTAFMFFHGLKDEPESLGANSFG